MIHSSLEGSDSHACDGAGLVVDAAGAPAPRVVMGGSADAGVGASETKAQTTIRISRAIKAFPAHVTRRRVPIGGTSCAGLDGLDCIIGSLRRRMAWAWVVRRPP